MGAGFNYGVNEPELHHIHNDGEYAHGKYDLCSVAWAEECEQPLPELEDSGPEGKQSHNYNLHSCKREDVN